MVAATGGAGRGRRRADAGQSRDGNDRRRRWRRRPEAPGAARDGPVLGGSAVATTGGDEDQDPGRCIFPSLFSRHQGGAAGGRAGRAVAPERRRWEGGRHDRWLPEKAVTFVDNHDTGSTQGLWPFPADKVMQGYAYILTHPGLPCIIWFLYTYKAFALQLKLEPHSGAFGMPMWVPLIATSPLPCLKETLGGVSLLALCQHAGAFNLVDFSSASLLLAYWLLPGIGCLLQPPVKLLGSCAETEKLSGLCQLGRHLLLGADLVVPPQEEGGSCVGVSGEGGNWQGRVKKERYVKNRRDTEGTICDVDLVVTVAGDVILAWANHLFDNLIPIVRVWCGFQSSNPEDFVPIIFQCGPEQRLNGVLRTFGWWPVGCVGSVLRSKGDAVAYRMLPHIASNFCIAKITCAQMNCKWKSIWKFGHLLQAVGHRGPKQQVKQEAWWLVMGNVVGLELYGLKRISFADCMLNIHKQLPHTCHAQRLSLSSSNH
ncbi:hypothetical protein QYE76_041989 [Lolium multiflorum]|uniref:1,4-alpha-D-glucan glucanohydrolase n=1 Tax=Lolium multiflorum TaxID=4521 RepID=A0AAD8TEU5_LOLMU|nr:hypothetical protein QYE76_041989 [Lolium multiflorum]